jgi:hypothetical protein
VHLSFSIIHRVRRERERERDTHTYVSKARVGCATQHASSYIAYKVHI